MLIVDNCHGENQSGEGGIRTDGTSGHVFVGHYVKAPREGDI